jgi:3,4-dihydroxy-2-butanone 4-phosphate synthase
MAKQAQEAQFCSIEEAIEEIRSGRMLVVCDDEDRENEGDLVIAAQFATPDAINFMAKHARGLICLALTPQRCDELGLDLMPAKNEDQLQTAFTGSRPTTAPTPSRSRSIPTPSPPTCASPATSSP